MGKVKRIVRGIFRRLGNLSVTGMKTGPHVTRYSMYRKIAQLNQSWPSEKRCLAISGSESLARLVGFQDDQIVSAHYPEEDMLNLSYDDGEFDCFVADQVLEHVGGSPYKAFEESFRVVKPGGQVIQTTCFMQFLHEYPIDYWRFSPAALEHLVGDNGHVESSGGWGNLFAWPLIVLGMRHVPIPHARWHPLHWIAVYNAPKWPIVTWVVARKV